MTSLAHADVGPVLSYTEYHSEAAHVIAGGAPGDLLYYDGTQLVRLPLGTGSQILSVGGGVPVWANAGAFTGITNIQVQSPTAFTVARANPNYALQIDTNTPASVNGLKITASVSGSPVLVDVISPDANASLTMRVKGGGNASLFPVTTGLVDLGINATTLSLGNSAGTVNLGVSAVTQINIGTTSAAPIAIGNPNPTPTTLSVYSFTNHLANVTINTNTGALLLIRSGATLAQHSLISGGGPGTAVDNTSAFRNMVSGRYPWWADQNDVMFFPQGFNSGAASSISGNLTVTGAVIASGGFSGPGVGNLDALTDVTITSPTNNQVLGFNNSTGQWINMASPASGGWVGTATSSLDMANFLITNIGNAGTDFTSGGGLTLAGDFSLGGTSRRITGDFSNATHASRVLIQTSITDGATSIGALPNGTSGQAQYYAYAVSTNPDQSSFLRMGINTSATSFIDSGHTGSATTAPLEIRTDNTVRARFHVSGGISMLDATDPGANIVRVAGEVSVNAASPTVTLNATTTTNRAAERFINGGGTGWVGLDDSAGTVFGSGTAYSLNVWAPASRWIELIPGGTPGVRVTIADTTGVTVRNRLNFATNATGAVSSIYRDPAGGLAVWCPSGSGQDFTLLNSSGNSAMAVPPNSTSILVTSNVYCNTVGTSAWTSTTKGLITNNHHSFVGTASGAGAQTYIANNVYNDGGWKLIINDPGALVRLISGGFNIFTFAAGAPLSASTPVSTFTVDNLGQVLMFNQVSTTLNSNNALLYTATNSNAGASALAGFQGSTGSHTMSMYACGAGYAAPYTNRGVIQGNSNQGIAIINTNNGGIWFYPGAGSGTTLASYMNGAGSYIPWVDNVIDLGSSGTRWRDVYCARAAFNGSHSDLKRDFAILSPARSLEAARKLEVGTYRYKPSDLFDLNAEQVHVGFLADADSTDRLFSYNARDVSPQNTACMAINAMFGLEQELRAEIAELKAQLAAVTSTAKE